MNGPEGSPRTPASGPGSLGPLENRLLYERDDFDGDDRLGHGPASAGTVSEFAVEGKLTAHPGTHLPAG